MNCVATDEEEEWTPYIDSVGSAAYFFGDLTYNDEDVVQAAGGVDPDWTDGDGFVRWAGIP
eukprot:SAG22_NODE_6288_length_874_cov_1.854194_1_plen_60_part_10